MPRIFPGSVAKRRERVEYGASLLIAYVIRSYGVEFFTTVKMHGTDACVVRNSQKHKIIFALYSRPLIVKNGLLVRLRIY